MSSPSSNPGQFSATLNASASPVGQGVKAEKSTYGQILKSSALIGGSSAINVAVGIVRVKCMALLLGPAGVGLMSIYNSIVDLGHNFAGMGISSSGVRQIAESAASGDSRRVARTVGVLRVTAWALGLMGAAVLLVGSRRIAMLTFGDTQHLVAIGFLSLAVLFRVLAGGQGAVVQGMRRVSDLAKIGVVGPLIGTLVAIPVIYWFRQDGVVFAVVTVAAATVLASWWYRRKVKMDPVPISLREAGLEAAGLLKLGAVFMTSAAMGMVVAFAIRTFLLRTVGIEAAGLYQAAWALGGLYVGFILQAMGADFLPRLTGVANDDPDCNRLVNEQALVSLLIAGPGVLATLTFAPLVLTLFYTAEFHPATNVLRWFCLGMALRVFTWPMGFIVFAKGRNRVFFWTEIAYTAVHVGLAWVLVRSNGLLGAGIAFFGSYVFHALMMYPVVRQLSGFRWSLPNQRTGLIYGSLMGLVFCAFEFLPYWPATILGGLCVVFGSIYSLRSLAALVATCKLPASVRKVLTFFGAGQADDH